MVAFVKVPALVMDSEEEVRISSKFLSRPAWDGLESSNGEERPSLLSSSGSLLMLPEPKMTLPGFALYSKELICDGSRYN